MAVDIQGDLRKYIDDGAAIALARARLRRVGDCYRHISPLDVGFDLAATGQGGGTV